MVSGFERAIKSSTQQLTPLDINLVIQHFRRYSMIFVYNLGQEVQLFIDYPFIYMKRIIYIFIFTALTFSVFGQSRKALNLYKEKRFAQAIPYLEKMVKKDDSSKWKSKLAECYRKTNQLAKAEGLYSQIVQRKHYSSKIMLRYGEVLMGLGKYEEAKKWFLKYAEKNPKDKKGLLKAEACDYVKTIKPYFSKVEFTSVPFNTDADDSNPIMYGGKLYFSSDRKKGFNVLKKKSGWTGRDFMRIYSLERVDDTTFTQAKPLPNRINNLNKNTGKPSFARNGEFYFTRNTNKVSKDGTYKLHIFHSRLLPNGSWEKTKELSFCQLSINYLHPAVSDDGKTLFFASNRKGGEGGMDLFVSERHGESWSVPVNIGSKINTAGHEAFPFIHPSGKLFFSSKGHNGLGGFDIFVSEQNEHGFWQKPINLGAPINSSGDDIGFYTDSLMNLALFTSTRATGNDNIFICKVDTTNLQVIQNDSISYIDSTKQIHSIPDSTTIAALYQQEYEQYGIEILAGDTILLVAPIYPEDEIDVPDFLAKQLDQLIPAMYFSKNLLFDIHYFGDAELAHILGQQRADAITSYLIKKHIPVHKIDSKFSSLNSSDNIPIFADTTKIVILVSPKGDQ